MKKFILLFLFSCILHAQKIQWETIDDGLELGKLQATQPSLFGDGVITVLKIDPLKYDFNLYHNDYGLTAKEWSTKYELSAVVNAGMFDIDGKTLGAMRHYDSYYKSTFNKDNCVFASNPKNPKLPNAWLFDITYQQLESVTLLYQSYVQSIRMISWSGHNMWSKSTNMWSVVTVAMDKLGYILFIHCRSPYSMHDFTNMILESSLNVQTMMYLEGGPEASLYAKTKTTELSLWGSYETNFYDDSNDRFWYLPNVIGIIKR